MFGDEALPERKETVVNWVLGTWVLPRVNYKLSADPSNPSRFMGEWKFGKLTLKFTLKCKGPRMSEHMGLKSER